MVRKTKTQPSACSSSTTENSDNSPDNDRKTFIVLSLPVIMIFNLLKNLLFELFIIIKFIYNTSSRLLNKPANQDNVNLETVKGEDSLNNMNKGSENSTMDLLQLQKYHHKKAFEFISQALKIDETQNPGV